MRPSRERWTVWRSVLRLMCLGGRGNLGNGVPIVSDGYGAGDV